MRKSSKSLNRYNNKADRLLVDRKSPTSEKEVFYFAFYFWNCTKNLECIFFDLTISFIHHPHS